jgi:predicted nicotinamide N-methyase
MKKFSNYCGGAELSYSCLLAEKRTKTFIDAVRKAVKKDHIVLEAGAGTGILSIVAATAGAKKVYAIEQNKLLIPQLKGNINNLGYSRRFKLLKTKKLIIPPLKTQKQIVAKLSAVQSYKKELLEQKIKLKELFERALHRAMTNK